MADETLDSGNRESLQQGEAQLKPEPKEGTPEWEALKRVRESREKHYSRYDKKTILQAMIQDESGKKRSDLERQMPQPRLGSYKDGETQYYLPSQQSILDVHGELVERAKYMETEFINPHSMFLMATERNRMDRVRMYGEVAGPEISLQERDKKIAELLPMTVESDLRAKIIVYEEALIEDFWKTEEEYARYMAKYPDLRERIGEKFPERLKEMEMREKRVKEIHENIDKILEKSTAVAQIWHYENMLLHDKIAGLLSEPDRELTDELKELLPEELRDTPIDELIPCFKSLEEQAEKRNGPIKREDLEAYVKLLRGIAVKRGYLDESQRDADIDELEEIAEQFTGEMREQLSVGEPWHMLSGEEGKQEIKIANAMYADTCKAHTDVVVKEVLELGRHVDIGEILDAHNSSIDAWIQANSDDLHFAGNLMEYLMKGEHIGPGSRPGGPIKDQLDVRERLEHRAKTLPEPLRSQILSEHERYGTGFEQYVEAIGQVSEKENAVLKRFSESLLKMIDDMIEKLEEMIKKAEHWSWWLPKHTGIGKVNVGTGVLAVAKRMGCEWANLDPDELRRIKEEVAKQKQDMQKEVQNLRKKKTVIKSILEKAGLYNEMLDTGHEGSLIEESVDMLKSLHDIGTEKEKEREEIAREALDKALDGDDEAVIKNASDEYREARVAMGASPEGLSLVFTVKDSRLADFVSLREAIHEAETEGHQPTVEHLKEECKKMIAFWGVPEDKIENYINRMNTLSDEVISAKSGLTQSLETKKGVPEAKDRYQNAKAAMGMSPVAPEFDVSIPSRPTKADVEKLKKRYVKAKELIESLEAKPNGNAAELQKAKQELLQVQREIIGAYSKLFKLHFEHIEAMDSGTRGMMMQLRGQFNHHAVKYAEYDYLKHLSAYITAGVVTTIAEVATGTAAGYTYARGYLPGNPIATRFRRGINWGASRPYVWTRDSGRWGVRRYRAMRAARNAPPVAPVLRATGRQVVRQAGNVARLTRLNRVAGLMRAGKFLKAGKILGPVGAIGFTSVDYAMYYAALRPHLMEMLENEKDPMKRRQIEREMNAQQTRMGANAVGSICTLVPFPPVMIGGYAIIITSELADVLRTSIEDSTRYMLQDESDLQGYSAGACLNEIGKSKDGEHVSVGGAVASIGMGETFMTANQNARWEAYNAYFAQSAAIQCTPVSPMFLDDETLDEIEKCEDPNKASKIAERRLKILNQDQTRMYVSAASRYIRHTTNKTFNLTTPDKLRKAEAYARLYVANWRQRRMDPENTEQVPSIGEPETEKKISEELVSREKMVKAELEDLAKTNSQEFKVVATYHLLNAVSHELALCEKKVTSTNYSNVWSWTGWRRWASDEDYKCTARGVYADRVRKVLRKINAGSWKASSYDNFRRELLAAFNGKPNKIATEELYQGRSEKYIKIGQDLNALTIHGIMSLI